MPNPAVLGLLSTCIMAVCGGHFNAEENLRGRGLSLCWSRWFWCFVSRWFGRSRVIDPDHLAVCLMLWDCFFDSEAGVGGAKTLEASNSSVFKTLFTSDTSCLYSGTVRVVPSHPLSPFACRSTEVATSFCPKWPTTKRSMRIWASRAATRALPRRWWRSTCRWRTGAKWTAPRGSEHRSGWPRMVFRRFYSLLLLKKLILRPKETGCKANDTNEKVQVTDFFCQIFESSISSPPWQTNWPDRKNVSISEACDSWYPQPQGFEAFLLRGATRFYRARSHWEPRSFC